MLMGFSSAQAQSKIGYLNSVSILDNYPGYQEVKKEVDELKTQFETEFDKMKVKRRKLVDGLENLSVALKDSDKIRQEKENELKNLEQQMEKYYQEKFGPQGALFKKNQELSQPIYDKVNSIIQKIGEEENLDYILDTAQGVVVFAKPDHDLTQRVIDELNRSQ